MAKPKTATEKASKLREKIRIVLKDDAALCQHGRAVIRALVAENKRLRAESGSANNALGLLHQEGFVDAQGRPIPPPPRR